MKNLFNRSYKGKTVLITGHTGFKGSWLALWLHKMEAKVIGYSLPAPTTPNHFELLNLDIISIIGDIRDSEKLNKCFTIYKPDIVFHLAAQALVLESYDNPIETYETNIIGTLKVFEACKNHNIKAIVNITSDKAYENKECDTGYTEYDRLGGFDPYSSSKACSEILTSSYRNSYFNLKNYGREHNTLLASSRAGNVIGGGDWAKDRLVPDIMVSISNKKEVLIRNPKAVRPWQHVLEPLSGYLLIGQKLLERETTYTDAWNFGPDDTSSICVKDICLYIKKYWTDADYKFQQRKHQPHEANLLKLDCSKAKTLLHWEAVWNNEETFKKTTNWYKNYYKRNQVDSHKDLAQYVQSAKHKNLIWTLNNE